MKYRKLQIAWSVVWGLVAVLFVVLWMRSYYFGEVVQWSVTKWCGFQFTSSEGQLTARHCSLDGAGHHGGMDFPDWLWSVVPIGSFSQSPTTILGFELRLPYFVATSYWAPVVICVALTIAPVLVGHPRLRFSLRTLLIAVTLIALLLGAVVYAVR